MQSPESGERLALRPVGPATPAVDHAEESERCVIGRSELVPGERRHPQEVIGGGVDDPLADQDPAMPAYDHDRMRVMVALERRPPTGRDLEIAKLASEALGPFEQDLPGDA